jgi:hypothetical protein
VLHRELVPGFCLGGLCLCRRQLRRRLSVDGRLSLRLLSLSLGRGRRGLLRFPRRLVRCLDRLGFSLQLGPRLGHLLRL